MTIPGVQDAPAAPQPLTMRRVAVIGCAGSGKSTFSRELGDRLGLPVVHLDAVHWKPGWVEPSVEEWQATVADLVKNRAWIIDGNYRGTLKLRVDAADTVIFLDLPRWLCLWRVLKRWREYQGRPRPDMGEDCPERLDLKFLKWVWGYRKRSRPGVLRLLAAKEHGNVFVLRSPQEVEHFLQIAGSPSARR